SVLRRPNELRRIQLLHSMGGNVGVFVDAVAREECNVAACRWDERNGVVIGRAVFGFGQHRNMVLLVPNAMEERVERRLIVSARRADGLWRRRAYERFYLDTLAAS